MFGQFEVISSAVSPNSTTHLDSKSQSELNVVHRNPTVTEDLAVRKSERLFVMPRKD